MKALVVSAIFATCALWVSGCATVPYEGKARDVKRKPQENGVIAIPLEFRDEDRNKAAQKMASNCGAMAYEIMEEGEVVVGQKTSGSTSESDRASTEHQVGSLFGVPLVSGKAGGKDVESSQTTTSVKEWQISYKCAAQGSKKSKIQ